MKQITVMIRDEDPDMIKVLDLVEKIGQAANELGLVVDATFDLVNDVSAPDSVTEETSAGWADGYQDDGEDDYLLEDLDLT